MAGILGITIGGLAAIAGQCQSPDTKPVASDVIPVAAEAPKPKARPTPAPADSPALPEPVKVPAPAIPSAQPLLPTPVPVAKTSSESLPALPAPPTTIEKNVDLPEVLPVAATTPPVVVPPEPSPKPTIPPVGAPMAVPPTDGPPVKTEQTGAFAPPASVPFAPDLDVPVRSSPEPVSRPVPVSPSPTAPAKAPLHTSATVAPTAAVAAATKFRIILRVGEGEPMFEVRHSDDLVMKVLCEKIDIKSPEKGQQGLSEVTATGKVRFVGFGAEGTCDTFSFLAGTGEVAMSGHVKVQVKDKIGRVESELIADQMRYKLDTSAMPGILKP
jgi:hypothetical protein